MKRERENGVTKEQSDKGTKAQRDKVKKTMDNGRQTMNQERENRVTKAPFDFAQGRRETEEQRSKVTK